MKTIAKSVLNKKAVSKGDGINQRASCSCPHNRAKSPKEGGIMLHSLDAVVNRFLTVCEDMYDKRVTDSGCCHNTSLQWALSLYLQRLQLLVRSGRLTRSTYDALVTVHEKDNIALRKNHIDRWNEVLASLDAAPDFPMTLRGDDVRYNDVDSIRLSNVPDIKFIIKVLRQKIANVG